MSKKRQTSVKLPPELLDRLDSLAVRIARPGWEPIRTEAILAALLVGLNTIEADPSVLTRLTTKTDAKK